LTRLCFDEFMVDDKDPDLFAAAVKVTGDIKMCLHLLFVRNDTAYVTSNTSVFSVSMTLETQFLGVPVCDTKHHIPHHYLGETSTMHDARQSVYCPLQVIPSTLVQTPVTVECEQMFGVPVNCAESFVGGGWVQV